MIIRGRDLDGSQPFLCRLSQQGGWDLYGDLICSILTSGQLNYSLLLSEKESNFFIAEIYTLKRFIDLS